MAGYSFETVSINYEDSTRICFPGQWASGTGENELSSQTLPSASRSCLFCVCFWCFCMFSFAILTSALKSILQSRKHIRSIEHNYTNLQGLIFYFLQHFTQESLDLIYLLHLQNFILHLLQGTMGFCFTQPGLDQLFFQLQHKVFTVS